MTSTTRELTKVRHRLRRLRRKRATVREASAGAALLAALLLLLSVLFSLDLVFELDVLQRVAVLTFAALLLIWAVRRFVWPMLIVREGDLDVALLVERQHSIDRDLVAGLQFDAASASRSGSPQLEAEVIRQAGELSGQIDFKRAVPYTTVRRRAALLAPLALAAAVVAFTWPQHVEVFFQRMLLRASHYPTRTEIRSIVVDDQQVLAAARQATQPEACRRPEGLPATFLVECAGQLPQRGELQLMGLAGGRPQRLELVRLTLDDRRVRLEHAAERLKRHLGEGSDAADAADAAQLAELQGLVRFDAPRAMEPLSRASPDSAALRAALAAVQQVIESWPDGVQQRAVYRGQSSRLMESIRYQIFAGDAWTDPAQVEMIPLPVVQLDLEVEPPAYARGAEGVRPARGQRLSVLEGSAVRLAARSVNRKRLEAAWLHVSSSETATRLPLVVEDSEGLSWKLDPDAPPLSDVREELRFQLQVTDEDGLHLPAPIEGLVRIRADRPPTAEMDAVHRVVLPTARPVVGIRLNDDYGIARALLHLTVERHHNESDVESVGDSQAERTAQRQVTELPIDPDRLAAAELPFRGEHELDLSQLQLNKGDQLKLTLEAVDDRGSAAGQSYLSEPLFLEVSDEAGVLAAISAADEQSEQRITEVIKAQLGIGESP